MYIAAYSASFVNCGSTLLISHLAPFCDNQQYLLTRRNDSDSKVKLMRCGILHLYQDPKAGGGVGL